VSASEKSITSVVTISSSNNISFSASQGGIGSGVIFSNDGYIVTNFHILSGKNINVKLNNGNNYPAAVIGIDKNADIAVLKINTNEELSPINIADSNNLRIGDKVLAIGNPYGIGISVSNGIISATGRDYGNPYLQLIQTDAAINPGNSGGALINENGNLIGINSKIFSRTGAYQGIGFAIPSNLVVQIATQLIRFGKVKNLWIGNFRVARVRLNNDNKIVDGLKIIEMDG
jgi:Trypsin-like serine proteases, typically periplasmic, contain C-terminal PDZ domain